MEERKEQLRVLLSASKGEIDEFARQNSRSLICSDVEKVHGPKLKLLQKKLGISEKAAGRLFLRTGTCRVLTLSLATLENKMDWLQTKLNLNKSQLRALMERDPIVLSYSIDDSLEPTIDNIQSSLKLSDKELTKMIARQPEVLNFNMSAENIKQRISLLQKLLGLEEGDVDGVRKYIKQAPDILFWKEESMKESQQWIQERFGLGDARIAQMSRNMPPLLYANTTTLNDKADSIQADLSLSDEELSDLVSKFPNVLGLSTEENVRPKLQYLRTRFELDDDTLKNWILNAASLFSLADDTIEEKLSFYSNLVGEREARRLVVESSNLLRLSNRLYSSQSSPYFALHMPSSRMLRWTSKMAK